MTTTFAPRRVAPDAPPAFDPDEALALPDAWSPPARQPLPIVASAVPVIGAMVLWLVTNSPLALVLAALGPLIAVASILDARRGARRDRRRAQATARSARARAEQEVARRHDIERLQRTARHPDAAGFLRRDGEIWRDVRERANTIVVGVGAVASAVRVTGGRGDAQAAELRASASRLPDAPIVIDPAGGVAVIGPAPLAAAVHRALVLQLCMAVAPGDLQVVGPGGEGDEWVEVLPHRRIRYGRRVAVSADPGVDADVRIAVVAPTDPLPPGCRAILTVHSIQRAVLDHDGTVQDVGVEAVSAAQAQVIAGELATRAERTLGLAPVDDGPVAFSDVVVHAPAAVHGSLAAAIGREAGVVSIVDLVGDGPHAVVAGVTGSGKSELLITWILAIAAAHGTEQVSFLLADFKGGTAFDALRTLPHVTGVITDLDGSGARRAIESLRAEVRWREAELARHGARDIGSAHVRIPRLVVVVDEFAALLGDHPELHAVFTDVAARGRALGIHLVLGTQRIAGVVRDSLLANCPLRLSLRVTDAADSRAVIGTDDAARLPGGAEARGVALVRRAADGAPQRVRVALSTPADVDGIVAATRGPSPRRPWLPALPTRVTLAELPASGADESGRSLLLGLSDEPELQRQRAAVISVSDRGLLVIGGPGAGKSTALATIASQAFAVLEIPRTGEGAWDAVDRLVSDPPPPGSVIVVDDLDTLATRVSGDHVPLLLDRLEQVIRGAGDAGILVVASAQRLTGPAVRLAELLPRRLLLGVPTRADHIAAGGDPVGFAPDAPSGRGRLDRIAVQVAVPTDASRPLVPADQTEEWVPDAVLTGLVTRRRAAARVICADWAARGIRCLTLDEYTADPAATAHGPVVVVGDPDEWQREWRLLATIRADHDLVIDVGCAGEYRILTASRDLPPYAQAGAGRAWWHRAGADAVRIVLAGAHVQPERRPPHP